MLSWGFVVSVAANADKMKGLSIGLSSPERAIESNREMATSIEKHFLATGLAQRTRAREAGSSNSSLRIRNSSVAAGALSLRLEDFQYRGNT